MPQPSLIACPHCDLLHRRVTLPVDAEATCTRCGAALYRRAREGANSMTLALVFAACILFVMANVFPILGMDANGVHNETTLLGAVQSLWNDGAHAMAALVFVTTLLAPAAELMAFAWILLALRLGWRGRIMLPLLHFISRVRSWGMVEVFVLGVLVSLVKLSHVASIEPGAALFSFGALMLLIAATAALFDAETAWNRFGTAR